MDVEIFFAEKRRLVNKALKNELERKGDVPQKLFDAIHYAVFSNGKRLRPILALTAFDACQGKDLSWILPFAVGFELIHTFSLINDDLPCMDNDDMRRGKPTLHKAFDETTALLAAMAIFAKAYETFCKSKAPPNRKIQAINYISRIIGADGIVAGQMMDVHLKPDDLDLSRLKRIQRKKTAEFIAVVITTGAIIAGAKKDRIRLLWQAGIDLGMLFQITDDILDTRQDKENQPTLVKLCGLNQARTIAEHYAKRARHKFSALGEKFKPFILITDWVAKRNN